MASIISRFSSRFGFAKSINKIFATGGLIAVGEDSTYHIFTDPGSFVVNSPSESITAVEYLIVAGGGGCGTNSISSTGNGAGGGAGGHRIGSTSVLNGTPYPITVGTGGGRSIPRGVNGGSSSAFSITSAGGGGGGTHGINNGTGDTRPGVVGGSGGSGGGGGGAYAFSVPSFNTAPGGSGGSGNSPPVSPPQGNNGAAGSSASGGSNPFANSGGGGGAGGAGSSQNGGSGSLSPPTFPLSVIGPVMPSSWLSVVSTRGFSRGGNGSNPISTLSYSVSSPTIPNSIANTGYGGHSNISPGSGSPGIVIVRYSNRIGVNTV